MSGSMLRSVCPLSLAYSTVILKVWAILLNSLSQVSETSKFPLTVITPFVPGIIIRDMCSEVLP
jgi:hypothetical protein